MTEPLWQNEEWKIYESCIVADSPEWGMSPTCIEDIQDYPYAEFRYMLRNRRSSPDLLYDAFLHLATYWDLKVDFDELRKIREEMKEASNA